MSDLQNSDAGRSVLLDALRSLAGRRLGKRLRRNFFVTMLRNAGFYDSHPSLSALAGEMNAVHDTELYNTVAFASRWGQTRASLTHESYYVDPINGSDVDGNGRDTAPFASLWFLKHLPDRIDHHYRILITENLSVDSIIINSKFGVDGSLSFIGQAAPTVVLAAQGLSAVTARAGAVEFTMPAPTLAAGSLRNSFLRMVTGAHAGATAAIINNTDRAIWTLASFSGTLNPADTFEVINPAITITAKKIVVSNPDPWMIYGNKGSRTAFVNLNIDISATDVTTPIAIHDQGCSLWSFTRILQLSYFNRGSVDISGRLNTEASADTQLLTLSQSNVSNLSQSIAAGGSSAGLIVYCEPPAPGDLAKVLVHDCRSLVALLCRDVIEFEGQNYCEIGASGVALVKSGNTSLFKWAFFADDAHTPVQLIEGMFKSLSLESCTAINALAAPIFAEVWSGYLRLLTIDRVGAAFGAYGIDVRALGQILLENDPSAIAGTTAAIVWHTTAGPATAAFPGTNSTETDALGSFCSRLGA